MLGAVVLESTYGLKIADHDDKHIAVFERAQETLELVMPGSSVLEMLPILAHLPRWLPGTGFLQPFDSAQKRMREMREVPWVTTREAVVSSLI